MPGASRNRTPAHAGGSIVAASLAFPVRCISMSLSRWIALAATALGIAATPALAADPLPKPGCQGLAFEDPDGDQANTEVPTQFQTDSTEILSGFLLTNAVT